MPTVGRSAGAMAHAAEGCVGLEKSRPADLMYRGGSDGRVELCREPYVSAMFATSLTLLSQPYDIQGLVLVAVVAIGARAFAAVRGRVLV